MTVRRLLHRRGFRYRLHVKLQPRITADLAFPTERIAVFIDGCFWHGCPRHGRRSFSGPNAALWQQKMERNRQRDRDVTARAREDGWAVVRLWECDIRRDPEASADRVQEALRRSRSAASR